MNQKLADFQSEFEVLAQESEGLCFATRAEELQLQACEKLESLRARAAEIKAIFADQKDNDASNAMLSFEMMIAAIAGQLRMWIALRRDEADSAWSHLVEAEMAARHAIQSHAFGSRIANHVHRLNALEKLIFPLQLFMSPAYVIRRATCSICHREYDECDHIIGRAYMGELCAKVIEELDIKEISIVDEPANKEARVLKIGNKNAMRDTLTWRIVG